MNDSPNRIGVAEDGILGRNGVSRILEPAMTHEEFQGLQRSADTLKAASRRIGALANGLSRSALVNLDVPGHSDMCVSLQRFAE